MSEEQLNPQTLTNNEGVHRIDSWLAEKANVSRAKVQSAVSASLVFINGKQIKKSSAKVRPGDEITFSFPPEPLSEAIPEDIPVNIVYEDQDIIVVDKKAGMVVHPAPGHDRGTLVNALLGMGLFETERGDLRPGIVHRIDKDTSGLLVVAKTPKAKENLMYQFKEHSIKRKYFAVIHGNLKRNSGTFDTLHGRNPGFRLRFSSKVTEGKRAISHYKVIKKFGEYATLVEVTLETGRTHQVRVHFYDAGHPLLGDELYQKRSIPKKLRPCIQKIGRHALHAALLGFIHPVSSKEMIFESDFPPDFKSLLDCLEQL